MSPRRARAGLLRGLYTLAGYFLLPGVLARLAYRGLGNREYLRRWGERLGWPPFPPLKGSIWVHAVSVGEVEAAVPLIEGVRQRGVNRPLVVTTITPTGSRRVRSRFGDSVYHGYLPYDLPGPVSRFLRRADPALVVVMETELWPRLFASCFRRGIPVLVVNARLSSSSLQRYRRVRGLIGPTLDSAAGILAQTEDDAGRFRELGAPPGRVRVTGNLKYEQALPEGIADQARGLRVALGPGRPVWVAASTHRDEEGEVLGAHDTVMRRHPGALLILVPRHPERFEEVAGLCRRRGLATPRRSQGEEPGREDEVYLADTMGELPLLYGAADVAFVGGSLVPVGGHNLLEPAALAIPVLAGPNLSNFGEIAQRLEAAGALQVTRGSAALGEAVADLLDEPGRREAMGEAGRRVVAANQGARDRVLDAMDARLRETAPGGTPRGRAGERGL